jgi:ABC-type branched-subunit amino acid transport system ATPase component
MLRLLEEPEQRPDAPEGKALEATGLSVSFGPIRAVRSVDIDLREGEILGIIGPNGAGKTTTFEMLAGFVRPYAGSVRYYGRDVTTLSPDARAAGGLVRSFQDAALFPTMSVLDVVSLSLERQRRSGLAWGLVGMERAGRRRRAVAHDLVDHFGLGRYAGRTVGELSTGTRRIVELACLTSLQPRVLLLDEPTAGIAQRETEALAALVVNMRSEFSMTIALIEHDIPFVTSLSDRMVAMAEGQVICVGTPEDVCTNDAVIDCYLGIDSEALNRSDVTAARG